MRRRLAFGLAVIASTIPRPADACDCPMEPPVEIALEKASAVVHARVAHVSDYHTWSDGGSVGTDGKRTIKLAVLRTWRGEVAPNTTIDLETEGDDCEHTFQKAGEEHVLYLHKRDKAWHVITCGRSVQMGVGSRRNGESEMALLDKVAGKNAARWGGTPPPAVTPAPSTPPPPAAASASAGPTAPPKGGCAGCVVTPAGDSPGALVALAVMGVLCARRRYLSRQRHR
ncbi:MAG: hypothetical protein JST00_22010 [Deltaproteobacteria bacterium]|nr:hypothetical protein [Deltaproteobacteria bacterium]